MIAAWIGLALFWCALAMMSYRWYQTTPPRTPPAHTFGSAEWGTLDYMRAHGLVGGDGPMLGFVASGDRVDTLRYNGDRHLLTIAPTGAGKGTCSIIPNLLAYRGSVVVIDPKGENATLTAWPRRINGHSVHIVDPWGITKRRSSDFNPLDWLEAGDIDIAENAMMLADALVVVEGKTENPFWIEEAKALLQGVILYVATDEREAGRRHLGRVRDLLLLDGEQMPALFHDMTQSMHHVVASTGARCLQKEERLLSNVLASVQAQTHFLDSPRLRASLSRSDFKFEDLKSHRPMTVYLVLPADRLDRFGRWLRLLIQQAITVNARNIETKPERPILFILDEMPALGRLTMVEQAFGLMRGFGMQLWAIAQDASQLKRIYGESWETFVANAGAIQYFGGRDRMTAEYFSALCGVATVLNVSSSVSHSTSSSKDGSSSSTGTTVNRALAQRELAYPDELMRLGRDAQLVLIEHHRPVIAGRIPWFADRRLGFGPSPPRLVTLPAPRRGVLRTISRLLSLPRSKNR
jgi:type IV secretion system protein VirD4